ncbi:MAG: hypothetical protein PHI85_00725 [Victivallaceae bacterium]|nr:hypothetical protein [Victivallaceae bacterium]
MVNAMFFFCRRPAGKKLKMYPWPMGKLKSGHGLKRDGTGGMCSLRGGVYSAVKRGQRMERKGKIEMFCGNGGMA